MINKLEASHSGTKAEALDSKMTNYHPLLRKSFLIYNPCRLGMRCQMRYFNTYGPVNETEHYVVSRRDLIATLVAQIERGT